MVELVGCSRIAAAKAAKQGDIPRRLHFLNVQRSTANAPILGFTRFLLHVMFEPFLNAVKIILLSNMDN